MGERRETTTLYRSIGLTLTPLKDKRPYLPAWTKKEYTDQDWVNYHGQGDCDFGLVLGTRSQGIVCVDIDPRNGGDVWYRTHQRQLESDCAIIEASGREDGGLHFFFLDIEGKFQKNCKLADGIDYLATGKQVVLAPSIHPDTGKPYTKVKGDLSLYYMELTPIPEWLQSQLLEAGANRVRENQRPLDIPDEITTADHSRLVSMLETLKPKKSSRHDAIAKWVTDAVGCGMSDSEIEERATEWMHSNGREPQEMEIVNWIRYAEEGLLAGTSYISSNKLRVDRFCSEAPSEGKFSPILDESGSDIDGPWTEHLSKKWSPRLNMDIIPDSMYNIQMYLEHHPKLGGKLAFNEMLACPIKYGEETLPWDSPADKYSPNSIISDADFANFRSWFSGNIDGPLWEVSKDALNTAIIAAAVKKPVHPIRDWLYGLEWDGTPRLNEWLSNVTGCVQNEYTQRIGECIILASTSRIMNPGTKWDNAVIFEGRQGNGKSTLCEMLAGGDDHFCDTIGDLRDNKVSVERAAGALVVELPEIEQFFTRYSSSVLKNWLSVKIDKCRMSYGKEAISVPRSYIVIGTTNKDNYLMDSTGERRYFPIKTGDKFFELAWFKRNRDQLFAEAREVIRKIGSHKALHIPNDIIKLQEDEQQGRKQFDPWFDLVSEYVATFKSVDDCFTISQVLFSAVGLPHHKHNIIESARVGNILRLLNCRQVRRKDPTTKKSLRAWAIPFNKEE